MIIKNFGQFWERNSIQWGRPGPTQRGHLKGYLRARGPKVDFRDQIGVYVLYDAGLAPVYVGQAGNGNKRLLARLNDHETDHLWNRWQHFSWFGFRGVNSTNHALTDKDKITKTFKEKGSSLIDQLEGILIAAMEPKLNKQGAKWSGADEYFQHIDDEMERPTPQYLATRLETVEDKIDKLIALVGKQKAR